MRTTSGATGEESDIQRIVRQQPLIPKENRRLGARRRSILRRPELRAVARALFARGGEGWIVGGAPRDILLGLSVPDVDLAVSADPWEIADELSSSGFGTAVRLSDAAPRVARIAGTRDIDLARIEGDGIREDLGRRDFTVNAIAIGLTDGLWIDPFGGIRDLARRRLRMISEQNLRDDPLRTLRAARLAATHALQPDASTAAACRRVASLLASAAPERIRAELEKLLAASLAHPALSWAARAGLLAPALGLEPELNAGRILSARGGRRTALDAPAIRRRPPRERLRLRLVLLAAALRLTPGDAGEWLASRRFPRATAVETATLLRLAGDAAQPASATERWTWVRDAGERAADAILLAKLLFPGPASRRAISARQRAARSRRKPPGVTGQDVLGWLRMTPGPEVGTILRELEVAGLRGAVRSRREARRWLEDRFLAPSPSGGLRPRGRKRVSRQG